MKGNVPYRVLIPADEIASRVRELAAAIEADYRGLDPVLVCNLKGAFVFLADLCRALDLPHEIDFIATASYAGTASSGQVRIVKDLKTNIEGRHVLLVEDIVDSGLTLDYVRRYLALHNPAGVKVVTLLDKPERRQVAIEADYTGFKIPDRFVFGYGLDHDERYRHLDFIAERTGADGA